SLVLVGVAAPGGGAQADPGDREPATTKATLFHGATRYRPNGQAFMITGQIRRDFLGVSAPSSPTGAIGGATTGISRVAAADEVQRGRHDDRGVQRKHAQPGP